MLNITNFFEKFKKIEKGSRDKQNVVIDIVKKHTKIELSVPMFEIKEESVRFKCSPVFRNEIMMKKDKIEEDLKEQKIYLKIT